MTFTEILGKEIFDKTLCKKTVYKMAFDKLTFAEIIGKDRFDKMT
jgi:hypothetical protein